MVGGGAVGVELAGEVASKYPDKLVSIIHGGTFLVTMNYGHKFQRSITSGLKDRNINFRLGL